MSGKKTSLPKNMLRENNGSHYGSIAWGLMGLLKESESPEAHVRAIKQAIMAGDIPLQDRQRAGFSVLLDCFEGLVPDDSGILALAKASSSEEGDAFTEVLVSLLKWRVDRLMASRQPDQALRLITEVRAAVNDRIPDFHVMESRIRDTMGGDVLLLRDRKLAAAYLLKRYRTNSNDWAAIHGLAVLYWNWACSEELRPLLAFESIASLDRKETLMVLCPKCRLVLMVDGKNIDKRVICSQCKHEFALQDKGTYLPEGIVLHDHEGCLCIRCSACGHILRALWSGDPNEYWKCKCGKDLRFSEYIDRDVLWERAAGCWAYLLGAGWPKFSSWMASRRMAECGMSLNDDQITQVAGSLRERMTKGFRELTARCEERGDQESVARIRALEARILLEQRFAKLLEKEIIPYVRARTDQYAKEMKRIAETLPIGGPTILRLLEKEGVFKTLLDRIDQHPPQEEEAPDEDPILRLLLEGLGRQHSELRQLLQPRSRFRLTRQHNAIMANAEEMLIYLTPIGPMMLLAKQGTPEEVHFLQQVLPSGWRDSALVNYVFGMAHRRAGDVLAGQGMAHMKEAVVQWRKALEYWRPNQQIAGNTLLSPLLMRRLPSMMSSMRETLRTEVSKLVLSTYQPIQERVHHIINDAATKHQCNPAHLSILDESVEGLGSVVKLYEEQSWDNRDLRGNYADALHNRATLHFVFFREDVERGGGPVRRCPCLGRGRTGLWACLGLARGDLSEAIRIYPDNTERWQQELSVVLRTHADYLYKKACDETDHERAVTIFLEVKTDLLNASELVPPEERQHIRDNAAIVCHRASDVLFLRMHNGARAIELKNEAIQLHSGADFREQRRHEIQIIQMQGRHVPPGGGPGGQQIQARGRQVPVDEDDIMRMLEEIMRRNRGR
ncbi:MAG TPA: hypothetical protein PLI09_21680 [Candidatus Hydrogenedentes bacterium]|nr:hypothetical protein [Candidatus Hydrogenedentota bacterium]